MEALVAAAAANPSSLKQDNGKGQKGVVALINQVNTLDATGAEVGSLPTEKRQQMHVALDTIVPKAEANWYEGGARRLVVNDDP